MRKEIIFFLLIISLLIVGCSRDTSKQISSKTAENIAFKEFSSLTNITNKTAVWQDTTKLLNGNYDISFKDVNNSKCGYIISVKYDGSKILDNKHFCY